MLKLTPEQIIPNLIFEITKDNRDDDILEFGMDLTIGSIFNNVHIPVGTRLITTRFEKSPSQRVFFKIEGEQKELCSYWSIFKKCTELREGTPGAKKNKLKITSNGLYNGFEISIDNVKENKYDNLGFCVLDIFIKFTGEFEGSKKINTKIINIIKKSEHFKEGLTKLIHDELLMHNEFIQKSFEIYNDRGRRKYYPDDKMTQTGYSGGKVQFVINIWTKDIKELHEAINKQIDLFIESKSTMS